MKKVIFISALAIAAAVSCTKSDIVDTKFNEEIGFETYLGRAAQTKAEVIDNDNLGNVAVYAYYTGNAGWTTSSPTNLWGDVLLITADGSFVTPEGGEAPGPKYWANPDDKYSFFAYAPVNSKVTAPNTLNPTIAFNVQSEIQDQVDLLYAEPHFDRTASEYLTDDVDGEVALTLKHALSRLTVKAAATGENFKFDVKEITVTGNFRTTGNLPLSTGIWDEATVTAQTPYLFHRNGTVGANNVVTYNPYIANNAITSVDYASYTYYTPGATAQDAPVANEVVNNYLMVIPSEVTMDVVVKYTTYYMNQESALITSDPIEVTLNLLKGKAYSITLNFSHEEKPITFSVQVEDWTDTTGADNKESNTDKNINA